MSLSQQRQPVSVWHPFISPALSSGSRHEGLADGGCSCSQVGEQAGDWLAFPLEQAHLSGEFTLRPFYLGSLSDWASSKELKVHTHTHTPAPPSSAFSSARRSLLPTSFQPEPSSRSCAPPEKRAGKKREHHKINLVEDCWRFCLNAGTWI